MTIQFKDGQILFVGGQVAMSSACCCDSGGEPTPCDAECPSCADTFVATLTGVTGPGCSTVNGVYTMSRVLPGACEWSSQETGPVPWVLSIYCYEGYWVVSLANYDLYLTEFYRWTQPHTTACPPATGWTPVACSGCACTAGSVVLS